MKELKLNNIKKVKIDLGNHKYIEFDGKDIIALDFGDLTYDEDFVDSYKTYKFNMIVSKNASNCTVKSDYFYFEEVVAEEDITFENIVADKAVCSVVCILKQPKMFIDYEINEIYIKIPYDTQGLIRTVKEKIEDRLTIDEEGNLVISYTEIPFEELDDISKEALLVRNFRGYEYIEDGHLLRFDDYEMIDNYLKTANVSFNGVDINHFIFLTKLLVYTGLRFRELELLSASDIYCETYTYSDRKYYYIDVNCEMVDGEVVELTGDGYETVPKRKLYLLLDVKETIDEYIKKNNISVKQSFLIDSNGNKITKRKYSKILKNVLDYLYERNIILYKVENPSIFAIWSLVRKNTLKVLNNFSNR